MVEVWESPAALKRKALGYLLCLRSPLYSYRRRPLLPLRTGHRATKAGQFLSFITAIHRAAYLERRKVVTILLRCHVKR